MLGLQYTAQELYGLQEVICTLCRQMDRSAT